jgi:ribosomal-protein-alanine N-acetyltransferase
MQSVTLRPIEMRDWQRVHEWAATEASCRFQTWGPNQPEDTQQFVADALVAWAQDPIHRFVWAAEAHGPGLVGLGELTVQSDLHRRGEIGYGVHLDWWGQGYGEAIARALLQRGFDELGLHRIAATCDPRNVASDRVLQKVGMVREGTLQGTHLLRDGWRDSNLYALVAEA